MDRVTRIGVSLEPELLESFDEIISQKGYSSRSEAIRDLIRDMMSENGWKNDNEEMTGVLVMIYNTTYGGILDKLSDAVSKNKKIVVSRTTVEMETNNKMDVIVADGKLSELKVLLTEVSSVKGVLRARFTVVSPNSGNIHHIGIRN